MRMPSIGYQEKICPSCKSLLQDPVQLTCGHSFCESCASDKLSSNPRCPECTQEFSVTCPFWKAGCKWKGKFQEYKQHIKICSHKTDLIPQEKLFLSTFGDEQKDLTQLGKKSPLDNSGRREAVQPTFQGVDKETLVRYICPKCKLVLRDAVQPSCGHRICQSCADEILKEASPCCPECGKDFDNEDGAYYFPDCFVRKEIKDLVIICPFFKIGCTWEGKFKEYKQHVKECMFALLDCEHYGEKVHGDQMERHTASCPCVPKKCPLEEVMRVEQTLMAKLRSKDDEIASLKATVTKLEKTVRSKNAELEDRDFRLSLIENSNYDGTLIWKIPRFSQRKADAQNGKYTLIFSLPFYTGRYGYKMCLCLYIMGGGIGKGTHLSLFFVVMRGEFDNILQWPFTHKVTFKLINQVGGRDIVNSFQPDPMSSSFRKPKSNMNIASGCPRFVSHTELECGGFVVDDTIFIKCTIDTSTVHHP